MQIRVDVKNVQHGFKNIQSPADRTKVDARKVPGDQSFSQDPTAAQLGNISSCRAVLWPSLSCVTREKYQGSKELVPRSR